jgi:hypothetical protein
VLAYLYLARCSSEKALSLAVVKIGISSNPLQRMRQLNDSDWMGKLMVPSSFAHLAELRPIELWWSTKVDHRHATFTEAVVRRVLTEYRMQKTEFFFWGENQAAMMRSALQFCRVQAQPVQDNKHYRRAIARCATDALECYGLQQKLTKG